jgi:predicted dehydrogenase
MGQVRVGLVGTSGWAELMYLSRLTDDPNGRILAISGRNDARRTEMADKYGITQHFAYYREMFASGAIDAVIVVTPDDTHREIAVAAASAGLHVLCEKPLATKAADAWEMQRAVDKAGVLGMVFFTWRWQPHFRLAKEILERGDLGRVARSQFSFIGGFARGADYQWRLDPRRGTGALGDLGSHMIDLARWMLGDTRSVSAQLTKVVDRSSIAGHEAGSTNDSARLLLALDRCPATLVEASTATPMGDRFMAHHVRLEGDKATLEVDHIFGGADVGVHMRLSRDGGPFEDVTIPPDYYAGSDPADVFDFYGKANVGARLFTASIASGRREGPSFLDGARVQDVIDAAFRSDHEGRRIAVSQ